MARAYSRMVTAIKGDADAHADPLRQLALGSYESADDYIMYPNPYDTDIGNLSSSQQKGTIWRSEVIPPLMEEVGTELDYAAGVWARITAMGEGVDPILVRGWGVSSVSKSAGTGRWTIDLSLAFASAHWTAYATIVLAAAVPIFQPIVNSDQVIFEFVNPQTLVNIGVNGYDIMFMGMGGM